MDQRKLIELVKQYPQIWDRRNPCFRDKQTKDFAWEDVGQKMNFPGNRND